MTLLEAVISIAIFTIGLVGIVQLQLVASRATVMSRRLDQASALASDLVENIHLWPYDDPRLTPVATVTNANDPLVTTRNADTRAAQITNSAEQPEFAEGPTSNALHPNALVGATLPYDGDSEGPHFERYWNVFGVDSDGDGILDGKVVVVIVRWHEAGLGYRSIHQTTFVANPEVFAL